MHSVCDRVDIYKIAGRQKSGTGKYRPRSVHYTEDYRLLLVVLDFLELGINHIILFC